MYINVITGSYYMHNCIIDIIIRRDLQTTDLQHRPEHSPSLKIWFEISMIHILLIGLSCRPREFK